MFSILFGRLLKEERGARRFKLAGFAVAANMVAKALGFLVVLYSTRVALAQLGAERFGVWVTISTIATLLGFLDLGVSNALISRVATLNTSDAKDSKLRWIISGGLLALFAIGAVVAAVLIAVFATASLNTWFRGISPEVASEARLTGYAFAISFGLSMLGQGAFKIYSGLQQAWIANMASAVGWFVSLLLLYVSSSISLPMWFYLAATYGVQQVVGTLLLLGLARQGYIGRTPSLALAMGALRGEFLHQGKMFFFIQIAFAVGWGSNQFILSSMLGPTESATFGVLQRLFMIVQVGLAVLNLPLWAMYADAYAHQEQSFIRSLLKRSFTTTVMFSVMGVAVLLAGQTIFISILSGGTLEVSRPSALIMAAWTVLEACGISFSMYLNGLGRIRPQAITGSIHTIGSLPIKVASVHYFGLNGLLTAMIISYGIFVALPMLTVFRNECFGTTKSKFNPNLESAKS